jgi:hypothetical protein
MEIRKNFGKYWVTGIVFAFITSAIQWIISYYRVVATMIQPPAWLFYLLIGVAGILIFIFVPWIYGRLIEWFYLNFMPKI